jgi:hypothetical protein
MTRTERPITSFRRRLLQLIDERFEGRYTYLSRRAGIPISTMEHDVHLAKRLPGGEHLLRMADALGLSVHYLLTGGETVRPAVRPPRPVPVVRPGGEPMRPTRLTIPVCACGCPDACPLTEAGPAVAAAQSTVVLEGEMVGTRGQHHLIALCVTPGCPSSEWPEGTRLVVDWETRPRQWEALALIHAEGRCQWGHLTQVGDALLFANDAEGEFRIIPAGMWKILGTAVAAVASL